MAKTNAVYWQNFVSLEDRKLILDKIEKNYEMLCNMIHIFANIAGSGDQGAYL